MPTDRLTMRSTIFDNSENDSNAAAEILMTPAMVVVSRMETRVELILSPTMDATRLQIRTQAFDFGKRLA